jgi:hypothetical protein
MPGDVDVPVRFFTRFTLKDLLRLALPVALVSLVIAPIQWSVGTVATIGGALGIGVLWITWTPFGHHVDTHLYHAVRWWLNKEAVDGTDIKYCADDHIRTADGAVVGIFAVTPTNLAMKTGEEQAAVHSIYRELFETVEVPLRIYSLQRPLDLSAHRNRIGAKQTRLERLQRGYLDLIDQLNTEARTATDHYVVIQVAPDATDWIREHVTPRLPDWLVPLRWSVDESDDDPTEELRSELQSRCQAVAQAVNTPDISLTRMTGAELQRFARRVDTPGPEPGPRWTTRPSNRHGEYQKAVYIDEFPTRMRLGWPVDLLRVGGIINITQVVEPRDPGRTAKTLRRLSEKLTAEIDSFVARGYRGTNKLEGLLDDVEWMQDLLADRRDQPVDYSVSITARAESQERCQRTIDRIRTRLNTMQVEHHEPVFRTDQAYSTVTPLRIDRLQQSCLMPASSAAAGFPFTTHDSEQKSGLIYGVDAHDGTPVILDRWHWASHSMARMGMTGSGKSYVAKIELLRAILSYDELQVYVVDPKQEYSALIKRVGGTVHTIGDTAEYTGGTVLGYQPAERGIDTVDELVATVRNIYRAASQHQQKTLVVIDEARILMNDETGRRVLNQFVLEARDTNTAITLISQNASHFTYCREGREILDNMPGKVFMRHQRVPDSVIEYFGLSQREQQALFELKTGTDAEHSEALLKVSGQLDTRIRIDATGDEHAIITASEHSTSSSDANRSASKRRSSGESTTSNASSNHQ